MAAIMKDGVEMQQKRMTEMMVLLILAVNGYTDLKRRRILLWFSLILLVAGIIFHQGMHLSAMLPGFLFLISTVLTHEKVGAGDGIVLLSCGAWTDLLTICGILIPGLLAAFLTGMVLGKILHRRKVTLPLVPFLSLSWMLQLALNLQSAW
ncbi:MAG: prepilin peptidase [Bilifractor sp.]